MGETYYSVITAPDYAGDIHPILANQWIENGEGLLIDVRTDAELAWVGFVPGALHVALKQWPHMQLNTHFSTQLQQAVGQQRSHLKLLMLCRSGVRSIAAAQMATQLGYTAYNILEGFEGSVDALGHRGNMGGWRFHGLPWQQD